MNEINDKVKELFPATLNCAQTVLKVVSEEKGLNLANTGYLMAGLGGGIGLQGEMCGAFTGALVAIGALVSREIKDVKEHRKITYRLAGEFLEKIKKEFTITTCNDLMVMTFEIVNCEKKTLQSLQRSALNSFSLQSL